MAPDKRPEWRRHQRSDCETANAQGAPRLHQPEMNCSLKTILWPILGGVLLLSAPDDRAAEPGGFQRQIITLPVGVRVWEFIDVNQDGRADLLAIDPVEKRVLIYLQRASGFADTPDQK